MTLDERRAAVRAALIADPTRSNAIVADEIGCHRMTVGRVRRQLIDAGTIEMVPTRGRDGRYLNFRRRPPVEYAGQTIHRIRGLITHIKSPRFSDTWARTTPGTREEFMAEMKRFGRVLDMLKNRMKRAAPPRPGPSRAGERVYRDPERWTG